MKKQIVSYLFLSLFLVFSLFAITNSAFLEIMVHLFQDGGNLRLDLLFSISYNGYFTGLWSYIRLVSNLFFGLLPYLFLLIHLILSERNKKFKVILIILLVLISGAYLFEGILHILVSSTLGILTKILRTPGLGEILLKIEPSFGLPLYLTIEVLTFDIIDLLMCITSLVFVILYFISLNFKKPIKIVGIIVFVLATILKLLFLHQQSIFGSLINSHFYHRLYNLGMPVNAVTSTILALINPLAVINLRYLDIMLYLLGGIGLAIATLIEFKGVKKLISIAYILPIIIMFLITMLFSIYYIYDLVYLFMLYLG